MKILVAATGGTIASVPMNNDKGTFTIALSGEELFTYFPELKKTDHEFTIHSIMCKGSSNMTNDDVLQIANEVRRQTANYDGIIVTHGTDTMAYTASLLSYLLLDVEKPVVMTGSMLSAVEKGSDAQRNMYDSVRFLEKLCAAGRRGVSVCRRVGVWRVHCSAVQQVAPAVRPPYPILSKLLFHVRGVRFGRPPAPLPENFHSCYQRWKAGKITGLAAAKECNMPMSSFRYRAEVYEKSKLP